MRNVTPMAVVALVGGRGTTAAATTIIIQLRKFLFTTSEPLFVCGSWRSM